MTTQGISHNVFALTTYQGRAGCPLDIFGAEVLVKLGSADTNGAAAVFQQHVPPMAGPPLHRHSREDEWFYVLDGEITLEIDGQRTVLLAGGSAFSPRGTVHTFQNFSDSAANMLAMVTPGAFQQFLEELSSVSQGMRAPDMVRSERLAQEYGIEVLGPPLS